MKRFFYIVSLLPTILISFSLQASSLIATQIPEVDYRKSSIQSSGDGFAVLGDEIMIYAKYDDDLGKKVIAYNFKTFVSETN